MPTSSSSQIKTNFSSRQLRIQTLLPKFLAARTPEEFQAVELEVAAEMRGLGDDIAEVVLKTITNAKEFETEAKQAARQGGLFKGGEIRSVVVTLLGGRKVRVWTVYLKQNKRGSAGSSQCIGRRGAGGTGMYPVLCALGIAFGVTPALADEICRQVADSDSVRSARECLSRRDIDLGHKQVLRIVNKIGSQLIQQRAQWLQRMLEQPPSDGLLSGRRVVVGTDGGRLRERVPYGGRKQKNGHRRYHAPWREPKLLVIYVIDEEGKVDETIRPVYDGTLGNCDAVFLMLAGYLRALGAHKAEKLIITGDGAAWIWDRVPQLCKAVGINKDRVVQVIDWYHAVENLNKIAAIPTNWSKKQRDEWVCKAKQKLYRGDITSVVALIDVLATGRRAKAVKSHRGYFVKNVSRMQYRQFAAERIPRGSGAIESTIRRVVNMRMKNNGTFWQAKNAEGMLMLRSYLKAKRFDDLLGWSRRQNILWWPQGTAFESPVAAA